MSLINDALKKAQRQRTGDSPTSQPPMPGGGSMPVRPVRRSDSGLSPQLLLVGAGAVLGLVIAGGAVFFLRSDKSDSTPPTATVHVAPADTAAAAKPSEPPAIVAGSTPAPVAKAEEPTLVVKTEPVPAPVVPPPAPTEAAAAKPADAEPPPPSLRMIESIEALRVAGIRASASDPKVLMNDRVYRLGDTVDHALGIKLTAVTANALTFRDGSGASYTRNF